MVQQKYYLLVEESNKFSFIKFYNFRVPSQTTVVRLTHLNIINTINVLLFTNQLPRHDSSN